MIGVYLLACVAIICLTVWDVDRRKHQAEAESDARRLARDATVRQADEQRFAAHQAHDAALKEHIADRTRYEDAMKNHEMRIRELEGYIAAARAPRAGGHRS